MNWYRESQSKFDHIPEENKGGDCFTQAFEYMLNEGVMKGRDLTLVHALIQPIMGPLAGVEYGHAWVEEGDKIIDTSRQNQTMDKQTYYLLGGLLNMPTQQDIMSGNTGLSPKEEKIHRYSTEDAKKLAVQHGYMGPWEEKFEDFVLENEEENGDNQY